MDADRIAATPSGEPRVRLSLEPNGSRQGMLDGAWWPRSRDPVRELPALIAELAARLGTVYRIGLNYSTWDTQPRRIVTGGHIVRLGWYGPTDAHAIRVFGDRRHHLDLLMVPPDAGTASAEAAMATASDPTSQARASEVLTTHGIAADGTADEPQAAPDVIDEPEAVWLPRTAPLTTLAVDGTTRANGSRPHQLPLPGKTEGQQS